MYKYNLVVCGGTFEHLHPGHKAFLEFALSKGKKVLLGLTSDAYIQHEKKGTKVSCKERKQNLEKFLLSEGVWDRVEITPIDDIYIPQKWKDLPIESIIVTKDSYPGAKLINKKRQELGFVPLKIEVCPLILADDGNPVSSSKIRNRLYSSQILLLPEDLRMELKKPFGTLITDFDSWVISHSQSLNPSKIITVGDIVTKTCNTLGLKQYISVVDFHVKREKKFSDIKALGFSGNERKINVVNKAGSLTLDLFRKVEEILYEKSTLRIILYVEGEEDLAVLPFILYAPIGFMIFYGQPNEGVVFVEVSEESKKIAQSFIERFKTE